MRTAAFARTWIGLCGLAIVLLGSTTARGEAYYGASAGVAVPWSGDVGWTVMGEVGGEVGSKYFLLGGEFQFSDTNRTVDLRSEGFDAYSLKMRTYELRMMFRFLLRPGKLTPYIGLGGGISIIDLDSDGLSDVFDDFDLPAVLRPSSTVGIGGGLLGLVGVEMPLYSKSTSLYAEGRLGYTWELTSNLTGLASSSDFSGFSGIVGVRMRY